MVVNIDKLDASILTPKNVNEELAKWSDLNRLIQPTHPRFAEYQQIAAKANELISRVGLSLTIPGAGPAALAMAKQAATLYQKAVEIRATMFPTALRKELGLGNGDNIESSIMKNVDPLKEIAALRPIAGALERAAKGLAVNPADVLGGSASGNIFFEKRPNGELGVNFAKVKEIRETVDSLKKNGMSLHPSVAPLVTQMEAALRTLESINPAEFAANQWRSNLEKSRTMNTGPLKLVLGLGGGMLAALGFGYSLWNKSAPQWPSYLWAGISVYSLYPNLFAGGNKIAQFTLETLNTPQLHDLFALGMKGPEGLKAYRELQDMDSEKRKQWTLLTSQNKPINPTQLSMIAKPGGALEKIALGVEDETKRTELLRRFGVKMNQGDRELMERMIETRV